VLIACSGAPNNNTNMHSQRACWQVIATDRSRADPQDPRSAQPFSAADGGHQAGGVPGHSTAAAQPPGPWWGQAGVAHPVPDAHPPAARASNMGESEAGEEAATRTACAELQVGYTVPTLDLFFVLCRTHQVSIMHHTKTAAQSKSIHQGDVLGAWTQPQLIQYAARQGGQAPFAWGWVQAQLMGLACRVITDHQQQGQVMCGVQPDHPAPAANPAHTTCQPEGLRILQKGDNSS